MLGSGGGRRCVVPRSCATCVHNGAVIRLHVLIPYLSVFYMYNLFGTVTLLNIYQIGKLLPVVNSVYNMKSHGYYVSVLTWTIQCTCPN